MIDENPPENSKDHYYHDKNSSIQQLLSQPFDKFIRPEKVNLCASGREDVDVRMLGRGRPFSLEFCNPRFKYFNIDDNFLENEIYTKINIENSKINVNDLQLTDKNSLNHLRDGAEEKKKHYSGLCYLKIEGQKFCKNDFEKLKHFKVDNDLILEQDTPLRVLHRRSSAIRKRTIYEAKLEFYENDSFDQLWFKLVLVSQAGTYVKEFVHGDFNRTVPNLQGLLKVYLRLFF